MRSRYRVITVTNLISVFALMLASRAFASAPPTPAATAPEPTTAPAARGRGPARTGTFAPNHNPALPTLFLIGDSTVKNSWDRGTDGLWGWGHPLAAYFDTTKINVDNQALGGTSSHSYEANNWPGVLALIKKGDFVIMQFGTNDNAGASLRGNGDDTALLRQSTGPARPGEVLHSFGWYLRKMVTDTKAKGATPIVASLVPRRSWANGKLNRADATHGGWAKAAAAQENVGFIDLNNLIADRYDKLGPDLTANLFGKNAQGAIETVHTNWYGSIVNAQCVVEGIKKIPDSALKQYLAATPAKLVKPATDPTPDPNPLPDVTPPATSTPSP